MPEVKGNISEPDRLTNSLIQVMAIICSPTVLDWEWEMRMLIMPGKSTTFSHLFTHPSPHDALPLTSGLSMMWDRNSPRRLSQRVEISGHGSSRMLNRGSRNSGRCSTI